MHFALPARSSEHDYPVMLMGKLCEQPRIAPFGSHQDYEQAKFRLLVVRNEYPVSCVAVFEMVESLKKLDKGDRLIVCGFMRHILYDTGKAPRPVLQVTGVIKLPKDPYVEFAGLMDRLASCEAQIAELNEDNKIIKDQLDAYGIKIQKKRDWREGAEPGSLW